jgi:hypothetical protein
VRSPQLYHLLVGPAVVHPDFIERVDFFPGIRPARCGRLLGGAIDGRLTRVPDRLRLNVSVDVLNASAFLATPIPIPGFPLDVTLAGRVSYAGPIAAAAAKAFIQPFPGQAVHFSVGVHVNTGRPESSVVSSPRRDRVSSPARCCPG